jgi:hypothetical protein
LERLHQLLHSLSPQQVKVLRNYLTSFSTRDGQTKYWELASLLLRETQNIPSLETCSNTIYKTLPDGRIEKLKNRLYTKTLDSLLIDINTNRDVYEDELHPIQIRLRKKMILYDLLKRTPLKESVGLEMIRDIIQTARQNELFPILLDALYILKWNYGMRKGIEFFNKMNEEVEEAEKSKRYAQRALDLYAQLGQFSTFNTKADEAKIESFLADSILELRRYYLETSIRSVGYFLKTFEMTLLQLKKDFSAAKEVAFSLIAFMDENKVVATQVRYGNCYDYIAEFDILLGNYESALKYILKARPFFTKNRINLAINKTLELNTLFRMEKFAEAKALAEEISQTNVTVTGDFRRDMILYYKACCHFMLGEHRECARLLGQRFIITQDKLGWEINIRFMRIAVMVERNNPDEAYNMVLSLAKHIERYKQSKDLNERDRMLLSLFRELGREGFSFQRPGENVYRLLLLLMETGKPHSWEPLSPELIQMHKWVIGKYAHFLPPVSMEVVRDEAPKRKKPVKKDPRSAGSAGV